MEIFSMPVLAEVLVILCSIITNIRTRHPDLVSFLQENPNAIFNVWLFWMQQVHGTVLDPHSPFSFLGAMKSVQERTQLDVLMAIVLIAVIHPDFLDDALKEDADLERDIPDEFIEMFHLLLDRSVVNEQFRDKYFWLRGDNYTEMFEMISNLKYPEWVLRTGIWMEHWNIFFGRIDPDGYGMFSIASVDFRMMQMTSDESPSDRLMFKDLHFFAKSFFENLSLSCNDLRAIGNTRWDVKATRFLEAEIAKLMKTKISQDAFNSGASKNHEWLIAKTKGMPSHRVTVKDYNHTLFPIKPSGLETISSIFVYEFWQAHLKPDEIQSYRDYLFWMLQQYADKVSPVAFELLSSLGNPETQPPVISVQIMWGDVRELSNGEPKIKDLYLEHAKYFPRQDKSSQ
jgi:hypothetical protein